MTSNVILAPDRNTPAPDFTLTGHNDKTYSLSDFLGKKNVILFFVRTYACMLCREHTRHLGKIYSQIQDKDTEVLVILNSDKLGAQGYADVTNAPFPVLADPDHQVYDLYGLNKLIVLSTRTGSVIVDKAGNLSYLRNSVFPWGWSTENENLLAHLDKISA